MTNSRVNSEHDSDSDVGKPPYVHDGSFDGRMSPMGSGIYRRAAMSNISVPFEIGGVTNIQDTIQLSNVNVEVGGAPNIQHTIQTSNANVEVGGVPNIQHTLQILLDCKEQGRNLSKQHPPSIYMVPSCLRDLSPSSFNPQVVSIGPLHREDKTVQEFQEKKKIYLHHLLHRLDSSPEETLNACLHKVNASIHRIRACYAGMNPYTDDELARMMVIDASFILEFLCPSRKHKRSIYGTATLKNSISHDLLLLENQIPFSVLQNIFDCTLKSIRSTSLTSIVLRHFQFLNPFQVIGNHVVGTNHDHILGLLQKSFHPDKNMPSTRPSLPIPNHSALELDKAGVKFKPNKDGNWQMAMEFKASSWFACFCWCWRNTTLRMPVLYIHDNTELFLRNVIAYEQCTPGVPYYLTSYACAIGMLVDTKEDIFKLVESKVLINNLGSNEDATKMINNISKEVIFEEFYYIEQWQQLDKYYNGYWPKNIARLKRIYFGSPWNIIALLAGFILFALTVVQTFYTIRAAR